MIGIILILFGLCVVMSGNIFKLEVLFLGGLIRFFLFSVNVFLILLFMIFIG